MIPRSLFALTFLAVAAHGQFTSEEFIRTTPWLSAADEFKTFKLPPGFEIQLVAAEPDLAKPISMCFDARGRLWIAESRFYPVESAPDKTPRDTIRILSDFGEDGRAQKNEIFADGLNTPDAVAPYKNGALVFSIPNTLNLQDTDGDGKADKREVLYGPFVTRDSHNMVNNFRRGFDGWIYSGSGVANDSSVRGTDGQVASFRGATFRFRADGSHVEVVGNGQVNVFGLCFDPLGNFFSSDCHSMPIYQVIYGATYPMFGKPDDGLGFGPQMMGHNHGSTAIAGLVEVNDPLWPEEFRGNFLLGNVVTSRVNRDRIEEHGSTKIAKEMPDLVSTTDPWFRPVDVQLGPDGALYIADFYNRIIAHVEVPLAHPGRDRSSGRIWRVVYRGKDGKRALRPMRDPSQASVVDQVAMLGDASFSSALATLNYIVDRGDKAAVEPLQAVFRGAQKPVAGMEPLHRAMAMWALERMGALADEDIVLATHDKDRLLRTHAMRVLVEREKLTPAQRELLVAKLHDADGFVARAAADALARHPAYRNIDPLIGLLRRAPQDDTHLVFQVRKALRDQLLVAENFERIARQILSEADSRVIADVTLAVPSAPAAEFLLRHLQEFDVTGEVLAADLRHIARYVPESGLDVLAQFARTKFAGDLEFQMEIFKSVQTGLEQRGAALPASLREWGGELATKLLDTTTEQLAWTNTPVEGAATASPWFVQARASADGKRAEPFLCSLPPGGEALTGTLRSAPFAIPAKLTFWIAGHDGFPDKPRGNKNFVRLRDVQTGSVLAEQITPRNDMAQTVSWDLSKHTSQRGVIELVDADTGSAYAWLAAGRFDPPVVTIPQAAPGTAAQRQQTAADLAAKLGLTNLEAPLAKIATESSGDAGARTSAVRALLALNAKAHLADAAVLLRDANFPLDRRDEIARTLAQQNSAESRALLVEVLRAASQRAQAKFSLALASTPDGADALLLAVAAGQVPAQLLTERTVHDKLAAVRPGDARLAQLTTGLKPASERLQKIAEERRAGFQRANTNSAEGAKLFQTNCAVCHSIGGKGGNIGPQLDGIGNRGLERLCEDVLDPNRNVDRIFRYAIVTLKNGDVVSGMFRREGGDLLVFVDPTGKETSVRKGDVAERKESDTSLMPEIFADTLPPADFYNVLAFLLTQSSAPVRP